MPVPGHRQRHHRRRRCCCRCRSRSRRRRRRRRRHHSKQLNLFREPIFCNFIAIIVTAFATMMMTTLRPIERITVWVTDAKHRQDQESCFESFKLRLILMGNSAFSSGTTKYNF